LKNASSIYDFTVRDINEQDVPLEKYRNHVASIVNVVSKCGLTVTNYKGLAELHDIYAESKGLRILAFPCNQEPRNSEERVCFARSKNAKFGMFEKIGVNGNNAHPLWKYLEHKKGGTLGDFIKWNFINFIIDRSGQPVERHGPSVGLSKLVSSFEKYW
jgi:glutathione peroxidase